MIFVSPSGSVRFCWVWWLVFGLWDSFPNLFVFERVCLLWCSDFGFGVDLVWLVSLFGFGWWVFFSVWFPDRFSVVSGF